MQDPVEALIVDNDILQDEVRELLEENKKLKEELQELRTKLGGYLGKAKRQNNNVREVGHSESAKDK